MCETSGDRAGTANALHNIGNIHQSLGNYPQALEFYRKSLELAEALGNRLGIAQSLSGIASMHALQGSFERAVELFQKSRTQLEALGEKNQIANVLNNVAVVHRQRGDHGQALASYQQSLALAEAIPAPTLIYRSYWGIAEIYRAQGRTAEATTALQKAFQVIEQLRAQVGGGEQEQQRFFENKVGPYQTMVGLLVDQNRLAEALTYAERARARVLLDVLHSGRVPVTQAMTATERAKERELTRQLVSLNAQISRENSRPQPDPARLADLSQRQQKARLAYEAFQAHLYAVHPELKVKRGEAPLLTLEEAGALLPDRKTALLEYVVTAEKTYLFVLTRPAPAVRGDVELKVYPLEVRRAELAGQTERFRLQLSRPNLRFARLARQLYDQLLKPAQEQIQGKTTLVVVPDGPLWELPFQALQPAANRFLLEEVTLSYAPSLTVLREMAARRQKARRVQVASTRSPASRTRVPRPSRAPRLLAFGNPAVGPQTRRLVRLERRERGSLAPLPEAEREVKRLARLYGPADSQIFIGDRAREELVKSRAGRSPVIHFATHGLLNDASPMYSRVLLSQAGGSTGEDGLLEAWELMQMDLKADLTVLSACETARGRVSAGEGVIGLSWALFVAGCPRTVVSQWKVADASTTRLMVAFHAALQGRRSPAGTTTAGALRQAALKLLKDPRTAHPYYWAPFVQVGDGR